ncbi:nematocyst expressed protein 4 isoform X1 [Bicyclus anynana]|uniref:Nematocyst expressed protein 4 isoform X1 n=1 Tax=Bicyclus anynana TaxID=110368 RepID=A0A6J1NSI2_BICAN|nr:nematocyst expressed protein 4 isoform X1 [Bicyclus anynana]
MFDNKHFDEDDYLEGFYTEKVTTTTLDMSFQATLYIVGVIVLVVLFIACCAHCCCRRNRGQVLQPPPVQQVTVQTPYPQQQYSVPYPTAQVVTTYPVHTGAQVAYPQSTGYPYPSMPTASPNPAPSAAPYPTASYPAAAPYPTPYPSTAYPSAPSAPEANVFFGIAPPGWNTQAMPPSYEQAVCAKPAASNPYAAQ